jgi:hypothetical protein
MKHLIEKFWHWAEVTERAIDHFAGPRGNGRHRAVWA